MTGRAKPTRYKLLLHPAVPIADLPTVAAYGPEAVEASRNVLDDLANGRVTGKRLGDRHVSGDLTGLARVKFDVAGKAAGHRLRLSTASTMPTLSVSWPSALETNMRSTGSRSNECKPTTTVDLHRLSPLSQPCRRAALVAASEHLSRTATSLRASGIRLERDDVRNLASYGTFDVVFCSGLLYHLDHPVAFLEMVESVATKVLLLHTHYATDTIPARFPQLEAEMTTNEGVQGRWFREHPDDSPDDERLERRCPHGAGLK